MLTYICPGISPPLQDVLSLFLSFCQVFLNALLIFELQLKRVNEKRKNVALLSFLNAPWWSFKSISVI